jgi:hydroxyacyl-ACP dehydratase HTD2-like protein with hotdog domain
MLLETLAHYHPEAELRTFEYQALNPVVVNRELNFYGTWSGTKRILLWAQDEAGVVGMKGKVLLGGDRYTFITRVTCHSGEIGID